MERDPGEDRRPWKCGNDSLPKVNSEVRRSDRRDKAGRRAGRKYQDGRDKTRIQAHGRDRGKGCREPLSRHFDRVRRYGCARLRWSNLKSGSKPGFAKWLRNRRRHAAAIFRLEPRQSHEHLRRNADGAAAGKDPDDPPHLHRGAGRVKRSRSHRSRRSHRNRGSATGRRSTCRPRSRSSTTEDKDFRLYKVLAAHGAGQIEFGTFEKDSTELKAAYTSLAELYEATADQADAFSLAG